MDSSIDKQIEACRLKNEELSYQSQNNFDKYLLTLSSGAFVFSITIIGTLFKEASDISFNLLIFAWVCWTLTILAVLGSFLTSSYSHRHVIKQIDNKDFTGNTGGVWAVITTYLNWSSIVCFLMGIILMSFFLLLNMQEANKMSGTETKGTIPVSIPGGGGQNGTTPIAPPPQTQPVSPKK